MDPEANYAEQKMLYGSTDPANVERRDELVQAMREWIRHGGFKPAGYKGPAWEPCKEPTEHSQLAKLPAIEAYGRPATQSELDAFMDDLASKATNVFSVLRDDEPKSLDEIHRDLGWAGGHKKSGHKKSLDSVRQGLEELIMSHRAVESTPGRFISVVAPPSGLVGHALSVVRERDERIAGGPGKFESSGEIGEKLHAIVGEGGLDDEAGDVNGPGDHWYGLILESGVPGAEYAVVSESNQGFFEYTAFDTPEEARAEFDRIAAEVSEEESEEEEEETEPFTYHIDHDERGEFRAHVDDPEGDEVFSISVDEDDPNALEDIGMRHGRDTERLRRHLVDIGIVPDDGTLVYDPNIGMSR